jgi:hypothetical protein
MEGKLSQISQAQIAMTQENDKNFEKVVQKVTSLESRFHTLE